MAIFKLLGYFFYATATLGLARLFMSGEINSKIETIYYSIAFALLGGWLIRKGGGKEESPRGYRLGSDDDSSQGVSKPAERSGKIPIVIVLIIVFGAFYWSNSSQRKAQNLFQSAIDWIDKGDYDQAIKDYSEAIKLDPGLALAWNNRGAAYSEKGDHDQAIKDYSEAIELAPGLALAWNNRGFAYAMKGDYDQAIKDYSEAIRLEPDDARAFNNRGEAYRKLGNEAKAKADILKAEEIGAKAMDEFLDMLPESISESFRPKR